MLIVDNLSNEPVTFENASRVAQLMILPKVSVTPQYRSDFDDMKITDTERGAGGLGSTGLV